MRVWLLTSTTYGTWLPGDRRGFVSNVDVNELHRRRHNCAGEPYDSNIPSLEAAAKKTLKSAPIWLSKQQASVVLEQFRTTAKFRDWRIFAVAIMANHFHAVVGAGDEVISDKILGDLKSYASRALNGHWPKPAGGTWWTASGSKRPLHSEKALFSAVRYVADQHNPLAVWIDPQFQADVRIDGK